MVIFSSSSFYPSRKQLDRTFIYTAGLNSTETEYCSRIIDPFRRRVARSHWIGYLSTCHAASSTRTY